MDSMGLRRDAITYSSLISALAKGKQWLKALQVRPLIIPEHRCFMKSMLSRMWYKAFSGTTDSHLSNAWSLSLSD